MSLEPEHLLEPHERLRLLQAVTGRPRRSVIADPGLNPDERRRFDDLVARRLSGEPLQYLEGTVSFGGVDVAVDRRALIPRPETEELLELAAAAVVEPRRIVDLCTGSGNLALALARRFPGAEVAATDISADALSLARENARRLGTVVRFSQGDLFDSLPDGWRGSVDLLVANPPYVADDDGLPSVVADHEPAVALFAGPDGLDVIRRIAAEIGDWLSPGAVFAVEVGSDHAEAALAAFVGCDARIVADLFGRPRFIVGRPSPAVG